MIREVRVGTYLFLLLAAAKLIEAKEFVPNVGQLPPGVRYAAKARGVELLASANGNLILRSLATANAETATIAWLGAHPGEWKPGPVAPRQVRYCLPHVPAAACTHSSLTFSSVRQPNLFPLVDLVLHSKGGHMEYDLEIQPGGRIDDIRFELQGKPQPILSPAGQLIAGDIVHWRPVAYQLQNGNRIPVSCALRQISDRLFGFSLNGPYNRQLPLVIDPVIESSSVVTGTEPGDDRLTGQAGAYAFGVSKRIGRPDWDVFVTTGAVTTYWGGEGEERVLGFDYEQNNNRLYLVGSTSSRDAYLTGTLGRGAAYRGGDSDGFFLEFSSGYLREAALLGGPGEDRIHDVRRTGPVGYPNPFLIAGETTDPRWPGFQVTGQAQGGFDAIAGSFVGTAATLVVTGGPGDDSAKRIRSASPTAPEWIIAGETSSPGFAGKLAPGRDVWVAKLSSAPLQLGPPVAWGGSGDDRLAGLAVVPGHGVMLAGGTASTDLPAANSAFAGGDSDGFLAWLDPVDLSPRRTRYLGGPGNDEILALHSWFNDLYLAGFTDSLSLAIPGLLPGSDPAGRQDGLFIQTDAFLNPLVAYRAGGSADDQFTSVAASEWGAVELSGWSDSRPWLAGLQPFPPSGDTSAGFTLRVRYPMVATATANAHYAIAHPPVLTIGRDLQLPISVSAYGEAASDEVLIARSLDPTKLRLGGQESVLLFRGGELFLEALAEEGEVEVLIAGSQPGASPAPYPERRLRVRLVPSRAYFEPLPQRTLTLLPGAGFPLILLVAPLLPNGEPGTPQQLRTGVELRPQLTLSDPAVVSLETANLTNQGQGRFRLPVNALREGVATLTLDSASISPAPNQQLPIRIAARTTDSLAWTFRAATLVDHVSNRSFSLAPGDQLRFTSADPNTVVLAVAGSVPDGSVQIAAAGDYQLSIFALRKGAPVFVRVEGQWQGAPVNEQFEILPVPYTLQVNSFFGRLHTGWEGYLTLTTAPQRNPSPEYFLGPQQIRAGSLLSALQLRFSNPGLVSPVARTAEGNSFSFRFQAIQLGTATLELNYGVLPEPLTVEVVPAYIDFGTEVRLPTLSSVFLSTSNFRLPRGSEKLVRIRVSDPALFSLTWNGRSAPEQTVDLSLFYAVSVESKGPPGQNGSLLISAPGLSEFALPIRVFPRVMAPAAQRLRLNFAPGEAAVQGTLEYRSTHFNPSEPLALSLLLGQSVAAGPPQSFRVNADPAGVCEFPAQVTSNATGFSLPFACYHEGQVTVTLQAEGWSANQARLPVQITTYRPPAPPHFRGVKLAVASGTQTGLSLFANARRFDGTLTSSDPDRVKLSPSPTQPGQASLQTAGLSSVYVQAFASAGVVSIVAEGPGGLREEVPVFLYPATMAVRMGNDLTTQEIRIPADQPSLVVNALPFAVDPGSGLLIESPYRLTLRAGIDPFFVKGSSTDEAVAIPTPPDPLFGETDISRPLSFQIRQKGTTSLRVEQPAGFVASPHAGLRLTVAERTLELRMGPTAPGLQTNASVNARNLLGNPDQSGISATATLTSLDPSKLLLATNRDRLGDASVTLRVGSPITVQVLRDARPGERLGVRLTAPGFADTVMEILVGSALLAWDSPRTEFELDPGAAYSLTLRYGPEDPRFPGQRVGNWSGGLLPGTSIALTARVADPTLIAFLSIPVTMRPEGWASVNLRGLRPGATELFITAPEGVANRAERIAVRVNRWQFRASSSSLSPSHGLWTPFVLQNPREEPTTVTLTSDGITPVGFGATTTSSPGTSLQVTLAPRERVTLFLTPLGPGSSSSFVLSAPDFLDERVFAYSRPAQISFEANSPLSLAVVNRTATLALQLPAPLARPGQQVTLISSAPGIVRVPVGPLTFPLGQTRILVNVEILTPGIAVLTAVPSQNANAPSETAIQSGALSVVVR